ncbi:MAG: divalent cation tolerance protein CutA [Candidatus Woesearchaeota archaeon]
MQKKNEKILIKPILIYTTCKDLQEAEKISKHLLNLKLIACSNVFPINSFYFWNEKIENSNEYACILKTLKKNYKKIEKEIKKIHSYEMPAIFSINIKNMSKEYFNWINHNIKKSKKC